MRSGSDRDANIAKAQHWIGVAASEGAELVVLPEFFNLEYLWMRHEPELVHLAETDEGSSISAVKEASRRHGIHVIATILEEERPGHYYDTAMVVAPSGDVVGKYRKVHPAATESLEKIFFRYGSHFRVFRIGEWRVGVSICYDNEIAESARCSALNGAELLVAPFATPLQMPFREMLITRASDNAVFLAVANKVGREGTFDFCGTSLIADPKGGLLTLGSDSEEQVLTAELDREAVREARIERPLYRDRRPELYEAIVVATEDLPRH